MAASSAQDRNLPASPRKLEKARAEGQVVRSRDLGHFAAVAGGGARCSWSCRAAAGWLKDALATIAPVRRRPGAARRRDGDSAARLDDDAALGGAAVRSDDGRARGRERPGGGRLDVDLQAARSEADRAQPALRARPRVLEAAGDRRGQGERARARPRQHRRVLARRATRASWSACRRCRCRRRSPRRGAMLAAGMGFVLLALAAFAAVDVPLQKRLFAERMKMSHQELKQEQKELDGNAEVKGKVRARMREMTRRRMMAAVPRPTSSSPTRRTTRSRSSTTTRRWARRASSPREPTCSRCASASSPRARASPCSRRRCSRGRFTRTQSSTARSRRLSSQPLRRCSPTSISCARRCAGRCRCQARCLLLDVPVELDPHAA